MATKSKVYAFLDEKSRVMAIDGGYTLCNIKDFSIWTFVDEGEGDRYNNCQSNYLGKSLTDDRGIYCYKYENGKIVERTQTEMDADYAEIIPTPSQLDRIEAQTMFTALMTDTLLEEDEF